MAADLSNAGFFHKLTAVTVRDKPLAGHTATSTEVILAAINVTGTRVVALRTDRSLRIWRCLPERMADPIVIEEAHVRLVERVSWNPRAEHLFASVGRDEYIKVWKGQTGTLERQIAVVKSLGQPGATALKIVAYSDDGAMLVAVDRDSTVVVYSTAAYDKVAEIVVDDHVYDARWFHHGHDYLALALHDGTVAVYHLNGTTLAPKTRLAGHRSLATALGLDPRGSFLCVGTNEGVVSVWNTASMLNTLVITDVDESVACVDVSRDGAYVACTYDRGSNARVYDVDTGSELYEVPNSVSGLLTFATFAWFPNKTLFIHSSDHGTTLTLMKRA